MKKNIKQIVGVSVLLVVVISYLAYQKYLVAATVNGKTISRLDIVRELEKQGGKNVLDGYITQQLIIEKAQKENITVSEQDIDKELKNIETSIKAQGGTLDAALEQKGMTRAQLNEDLQIQVMLQKLIKADEIKVTDKEVEVYIADNKEQFPADAKVKPDTKQIKEELRQEKLNSKIQEFVTNLRTSAKITYFGSYK